MVDNYLNPDQIAIFKRDGVLVIPNFYQNADILPIQRGIYAVIGQIMKRHGIEDKRVPFSQNDFDDRYLDLIQQNRTWGGEVYDAIKQIPAFVRLVAHPIHEVVMTELRENAQSGLAAGGYGIRIDNPFEDRFRAMWHQEYPAQLRSVDGLVFWSPLLSITNEIGPVMFCPGSHKEGVLRVQYADPENVGRSGAYALKIESEDTILKKYPTVAPLTKPGDLVVIDFLVLHASGINRSNRARWSMQFRYFNFADPIGRTHGWKGSYAAGIDFRTVHPELYKA